MNKEYIILEPHKMQWVNELFGESKRFEKNKMVLKAARIAGIPVETARMKLFDAVKQGYIFPCIEKGYEMYYERSW